MPFCPSNSVFCSLSDCVSNDEVGMSWHQVEKKAYEYGELSGADIAFFIYLDLIAMGKKAGCSKWLPPDNSPLLP
jgi:hypothetical protein